MKNINTKPIKDGDTYKYLGIDEKTSYVGTVNKDSTERIFNQGEEKKHSNFTKVT